MMNIVDLALSVFKMKDSPLSIFIIWKEHGQILEINAVK